MLKYISLLLLAFPFFALSQKTYTIDYSKESLLNPNCIFNGSGVMVQKFRHYSSLGTVVYNTAQKALQLNSKEFQNNAYQLRMNVSGYAIEYHFKKKFKYDITASLKTSVSQGTYYTYFLHAISNTKGNAVSCGDVTDVPTSWEWPNNQYAEVLLGNSETLGFKDKSIVWDYMPDNHFNYFLLAAKPSSSGSYVLDTLFKTYVQKIVIKETSGLNITPATTTVTCGDTQPVTFTVNNPYNIDYISGYTWFLDSANNGWKYNGNNAPVTISTAENTITLSPICGKTPVNVKAIVSFTGTDFKDTLIANVQQKIPSKLFITGGGAAFCSGSRSYAVAVCQMEA